MATTAPSVVAIDGIDVNAELDLDLGAVVTPFDRFTLSPLEADLVSVAGTVEVAACAQGKGVHFVAPRPIDDSVYESEHYFGPWTVAQAERFGFVRPMSQADLMANGVQGASGSGTTGELSATENAALTDADWDVVDECGKSAEVEPYRDALSQVGPWTEQIAAISATMQSDSAMIALLSELDKCYREAGLTPEKDEPWLVAGADDHVIDEQQVTLALAVVDCKESIDFTRRAAAVEAAYQAPVIARYSDELLAQRAQLDEMISAARELIAARDDLLTAAPDDAS